MGKNVEQGPALAYVEPEGGWVNSSSPIKSLTANPGREKERFSDSKAISGNTLVVGAPIAGGDLQSAVYIFESE